MKKGLPMLLVLCFVVARAQAQLCQGSLGDPIVNITFGAGPNPGAALPAAATGYQHVNSDCPNDGQYAVRNRTDNCYGTWHTLASDHTGNPNGYFMLVNASFQPSAFYLDTVDLFCSNTTYEFAAWAINMMRSTICGTMPGIEPNLTFSIEKTDGTVLQTVNTGNVPVFSTPTWTQYGFFFTAPTGINRVVLRITNNAPGGCGNDLAIDDITFRPCGPQISISSGAGSQINICQGQNQQVNLTSTISAGYTDPFYQWQQSMDGSTWTDIAGANTPSLSKNFAATTAPGDYRYRLSVAKMENSSISVCRVNSAVITVRINPRHVIALTNNSPVCANKAVTLTASGGATYNWSGPNGFTATGTNVSMNQAQVGQSGRYYVQVSSTAGCSEIDSADVVINPTPVATVSPGVASICEGETVALNSSGGTNYLWTPATGLSAATVADPIASPADSTSYQVIVSNTFSCADTATVQINVFKKPIANAGPDIEMVTGQSGVLNGFVGGTGVSYSWSPNFFIDDIHLIKPLVNPLQDTSYMLTVVSSLGCGTATDIVHVKVFKGIFVPGAFSPNGDGLNDQWRVPGLGLYKDHEVMVYNRYGQMVFKTTSNQPWNGSFNGKQQPTGVYIYLIRIKEIRQLLKGTVTIVR